MATAYDSVRYPGYPYPQTDPAALGVIAGLFGLPFAPAATCRVLEIGCGEGVNLIGLALAAPGARFVGVDLAETAIASARADAAACGLANVEFRAADLRDIGTEFGAFDYIVAHGVLSWVPEPVRAALYEVAGERLAPGGVAMLSFATLPGARSLQAVRDMLLYETRAAASPDEKLNTAYELLESYVALWSEKDADTAHVRFAARRLLNSEPGALFHDEMSDFYQPLLLADVAAGAAAHGLAYLADARPRELAPALFPSDATGVARRRAGGDWTRFQQYLDFQDMRSFHNAVFVKGGAPDRRRDASRLEGLWMQAELSELPPDPEKPGEAGFVTREGVRLLTNDPRLVALFRGLANAYPEALRLGGSDLAAVAEHVFRLYVGQHARLSTSPPRARRDPGPRPMASPFARLQAARGARRLTSLTQSVAELEEGPLTRLVPLLDGTRAREEIARLWAADIDATEAADALGRALDTLSRAGLLMDAAAG